MCEKNSKQRAISPLSNIIVKILSLCFAMIFLFGCASCGSLNGESGGSSASVSSSEGKNEKPDEPKAEQKKLNEEIYLALSAVTGDETTSILYNAEGGPFRCAYVYAPDEKIRGDFNSVEFSVDVKIGGGCLFIAEGTNRDVSSAWGDSAGYTRVTAISDDYYGKVAPFKGQNSFAYANASVLKIYSGEKEIDNEPLNFISGQTYRFVYRLAKNNALTFFYTKSVYDENDGSFCWGGWNKGYCFDLKNCLDFRDFYAVDTDGEIMEERKENFTVAGYNATVLIPEKANGEWIWKTEFFYAFDKAEQELYGIGYTRVYFEISDKYGSPDAVALMGEFYNELIKRYAFLDKKCHLVGFSRGGLYAFNFALKYPERVKSVYLDAPVLDLRSWPRTDPKFNELSLHEQVMNEYGFKNE